MEKTLEQLQVEFVETFGKEVPNNKKNDAEWIASKIAEAQKVEEENQTTNPDENSDESEVDNNSVDNQVMTQEARKVGNIVYPV